MELPKCLTEQANFIRRTGSRTVSFSDDEVLEIERQFERLRAINAELLAAAESYLQAAAYKPTWGGVYDHYKRLLAAIVQAKGEK